jgi:PAS domain S-box-containing protein
MKKTAATLAKIACLALAYLVAARFGLFFTVDSKQVAILWPAAGIALAGLVVWGSRYWPAVAAGALLQPILWGQGFGVAAGIAFGNTASVVVGAEVLRRLRGFDPHLTKLHDVLILAAVGAVFAPLISATIGIGTLSLAGKIATDALPMFWATWWASDAFGVLLVAPLVLSWAGRGGLHVPERPPRRELAFDLSLIMLASWLVVWHGALRPGVLFVPILLLAVRHGVRGAATLMPAVAMVAAMAASQGVGAYAGLEAPAATGELYGYLMALCSVGLVTGAAVSERELTTQALRAANEAQRAILDACPVAIVALDLERRCTMWSGAAERMFGWSASEVVGRPLSVLPYLPPDKAGEFEELWKRQLAGQQVLGHETTRLRRDGALVPVSLSVAFLKDGIGRPVGLMGVLEDVTARRAAEAALNRSEAQFRQAQKLGAVGRLAGAVAHDFNNLLTVILGNVQLAIDGVDRQAEARTDLEQVHEAARKAATLTRQLLTFSRKQVLERKVFDLNEVITDLGTMIRRLIGADIEFALNLQSNAGKVDADPGQIEQVIMNLVVNARDAMPEGGKLTIEASEAVLDAPAHHARGTIPPGSYSVLAVSDTGVGMTPQVQEHLFEPFFTTKEAGKGTGLGLATVHGIVSQSEGHVVVYSEHGAGTTFKIYLPKVPDRMNGASTSAELAAPHGTETILLAEDDDAVRAVAERVLRGHGYAVLAARDPAAALALLKEHRGPVDLLLTDVIMPQISGRHLASEVAELRPGTPVLYMSGYTDDAVLRHGVLDAGLAYLEKPFTPGTLLRKVREVLDS